ncbi:MAG TPA: NADH-quinone oxidoreductase subunit L, partial [Polyangiaceae bacterium]|nr:NADH-quinone oxidoreductase subunit L [Polyangiaceae bacterium]
MELLNSLFPNPGSSFPLLAVILGMPALGAFVNGIFGKRLGPAGVRLMALSSVGVSFAAALVTFFMLRGAGAGDGQHVRFVWNAWQWIPLDSTRIDVSFCADNLSAVMLLVVTGVGFLIHLYAVAYMAGDPGFHRFFAYMNLFIFSMLVLVLGDSLPILFVGWEGVGMCSYLLIGFWFEEGKNAAAGTKAFIANRIGDFGLLVAMAMIIHYVGTLSWQGIDAQAGQLLTRVQVWPLGHGLPSWFPHLLHTPRYVNAATLVGLALMLGCAGKSAQIPLYVWLPDAMAGPTPVSALIHAATMVTAGVYLVARMNVVFMLSPTTMMIVAAIGAITAVFAATIGLVQNDLKKVLAYSTVSQLGYMFVGVGVGAFASGIFHVVTH